MHILQGLWLISIYIKQGSTKFQDQFADTNTIFQVASVSCRVRTVQNHSCLNSAEELRQCAQDYLQFCCSETQTSTIGRAHFDPTTSLGPFISRVEFNTLFQRQNSYLTEVKWDLQIWQDLPSSSIENSAQF